MARKSEKIIKLTDQILLYVVIGIPLILIALILAAMIIEFFRIE